MTFYTTVFDLDGVLIDSEEANRVAYRSAGVEPPDDFFGRSASDWLRDRVESDDEYERIHRVKTNTYISMIRNDHHVRPLSPQLLLRRLWDDPRFRVVVMTGASWTAAINVLARHDLRVNRLYAECNRRDKHRFLEHEAFLIGHNKIVMIDDQPDDVSPTWVITYDRDKMNDITLRHELENRWNTKI